MTQITISIKRIDADTVHFYRREGWQSRVFCGKVERDPGGSVRYPDDLYHAVFNCADPAHTAICLTPSDDREALIAKAVAALEQNLTYAEWLQRGLPA